MDLTTLMAYVFNCAVCSTIAVVFLISPVGKEVKDKIDSYSKAKLCLGASALIEAFTSLLYIHHLMNGIPFLPLDSFTDPLFLYFAICIDLSAIIYLLHGKQAKRRTFTFYFAPVLLIWLAHTIIYIADHGILFDAKVYSEFLTTQPAIVTCYTLYVVFFIEFIIILRSINQLVKRFKEHIDNYYSGRNHSRSRWLIAVVATIVVYYIVSIADTWITDLAYDPLFLWLRTILVFVNSIAFIKCRNIYWTIKPAFAVNSEPTAPTTATTAASEPSECPIAEPKVAAEPVAAAEPASTSIDTIVNEWTQRKDKPYLKESITIMQVAEEMGLNTRLLSNYINSVKGRNFNAWINYLKVEETKRVLLADRTQSLSDIAFQMGFNDLAAMSKIFKSIEGMPPSVYRQTH